MGMTGIDEAGSMRLGPSNCLAELVGLESKLEQQLCRSTKLADPLTVDRLISCARYKTWNGDTHAERQMN